MRIITLADYTMAVVDPDCRFDLESVYAWTEGFLF